MQTVTEISEILIELLREQEFLQAYKRLFSDDAESIDPLNPKESPIKGLDKLIDLETQFLSRATIHQVHISDAIQSGAYFSIQLVMHFSIGGEEKTIDELCVYKVRGTEIISQQFLFLKSSDTGLIYEKHCSIHRQNPFSGLRPIQSFI
jgi:hypothetical protein